MTYITQDIILQFNSYLKENCPAWTEIDRVCACFGIVIMSQHVPKDMLYYGEPSDIIEKTFGKPDFEKWFEIHFDDIMEFQKFIGVFENGC